MEFHTKTYVLVLRKLGFPLKRSQHHDLLLAHADHHHAKKRRQTPHK
jgi:hypothetical protein